MKKFFSRILLAICVSLWLISPITQLNVAFSAENNNSSTETLLNKIKHLEQQNADKNSIAELYIQLSDVYASNKDYKQSLLYDKLALKLLSENQKVANPKLLALAFMQTGSCSYTLGDIQSAIMGYIGAIETLKKNNILEAKSNSANNIAFLSIYNLAEIYKQIHKLDKAKEYYNLLLKTQFDSYDASFDLSVSMAFYSLGYIYQKEGNYEQALKNYNSCIKGVVYYKHQAEPAGKELICHSLIGLGESFAAQGKYDEALKAYSYALSITIENFKNDYDVLSRIYSGLGLVYYKQKNYKLAKSYYEKAVSIYDEFYNPKINKQDKKYQEKLRKYFPRKAKYIGTIVIVPDDSVFDTYKNLIEIYKATNSGNFQRLEDSLKEYDKAYSPTFRKFMEQN